MVGLPPGSASFLIPLDLAHLELFPFSWALPTSARLLWCLSCLGNLSRPGGDQLLLSWVGSRQPFHWGLHAMNASMPPVTAWVPHCPLVSADCPPRACGLPPPPPLQPLWTLALGFRSALDLAFLLHCLLVFGTQVKVNRQAHLQMAKCFLRPWWL